MISAQLLSCTRVSQDERYNAFTGITYFEGYYWVVYRTGKGHVSPFGKIVIQKSKDAINWEIVNELLEPGIDLRDSRISVIFGKLIVMCFSLEYYKKTPPYRYHRSNSYFFTLNENGVFEKLAIFEYEKYKTILWSLVQIDDEIYCSGYRLDLDHSYGVLWKSKSMEGPWELVSEFPDKKIPPKLGINEVDLVVNGDKSISAFCRIDGDNKFRVRHPFKYRRLMKEKLKQRRKGDLPLSPTGYYFQVCQADPPYTEWTSKMYTRYLKGPRAFTVKDQYIFVGRALTSSSTKKRSVVLFRYDGEFHPLITLGTGKDGSYAGICASHTESDVLYVSFYSDHERRGTPLESKTNDIWVAKIKIS